MRWAAMEHGDVGRGADSAHRLFDSRLDALMYAKASGLAVAIVYAGPDGDAKTRGESRPFLGADKAACADGFADGAAGRPRRKVDRRTNHGRWYTHGYENGVAAVAVAFYSPRSAVL